MDNQRVFIWAALALVLYLNYDAWQRDYAPAPIAPAAAAPSSAANGSAPAEDTLPALPSETASAQQPQPSATPAPTEQPVEATQNKASVIRVTTDVLSMDIS